MRTPHPPSMLRISGTPGRASLVPTPTRREGRLPMRLNLPFQILLHVLAQALAQVGTRHAESDVGAQEARLRAAIVPLALELDAVELLRLRQPDHRIRELDLA